MRLRGPAPFIGVFLATKNWQEEGKLRRREPTTHLIHAALVWYSSFFEKKPATSENKERRTRENMVFRNQWAHPTTTASCSRVFLKGKSAKEGIRADSVVLGESDLGPKAPYLSIPRAAEFVETYRLCARFCCRPSPWSPTAFGLAICLPRLETSINLPTDGTSRSNRALPTSYQHQQ